VIDAPPLFVGAVNDTIAEESAATPLTEVGAPGTVDGIDDDVCVGVAR
jgi:hypothetical protein